MKQNSFSCLKTVLLGSLVVIFVFGIAASNGYATNGYFAGGYSIKNKALAGAGAALPLDSLAASTNPAGMVFVGNRIDVGVTFFNPNREYTVEGAPTPVAPAPGGLVPGIDCGLPVAPAPGMPPCPFGFAPGTFESDSKWFVIPSLGFNWMMNNNYSLGISIYGNGGMNTNYDTNTYFDSVSSTGVDLAQLFVVPTYARKLHPKHAIGISPIFAYQRFEQIGLQPLGDMGFSSDPAHIANNGHENSFGYGARIGYLGEILPDIYLGISYQTKIYMSELDDYEGLFAEQGDFDIPANWTIGAAFKITPALIVALDVQQIYYSDVNAVGNPMLPNLSTSLLGDDNGAGFGWDDMTVVKLGVQWQSSPEWTWRAGYSITDQPIPSSEMPFNILSPGVIEQHLTAGFTRTIGNNHEIDFALIRAFSKDIEGSNPLDPAQKIELKMDQWEIAVGYTYKF